MVTDWTTYLINDCFAKQKYESSYFAPIKIFAYHVNDTAAGCPSSIGNLDLRKCSWQ